MSGIGFLWILFGTLFLLYAVYGCVLMYHWFSFGFNNQTALIASIAYIAAGSFALALFAGALV